MIGFNRTVFRHNGGTFNDRQNIALNPFPETSTLPELELLGGDFIDFIDKDDSLLFRPFDRLLYNFIHVD